MRRKFFAKNVMKSIKKFFLHYCNFRFIFAKSLEKVACTPKKSLEKVERESKKSFEKVE